MRILIGTLYSGENEFEACKQSVHHQTHKDHSHIIIENLPKQEAHHKLFSTFMDKCQEYDLFIKLDADMVIEESDFFERVCDRFHNNPTLDFFMIPVHDFFLNEPIWGLHCYRNTVTWNLNDEKLFTDANTISNDRKEKNDTDFNQAVSHCKNPSAFQCFHFGIHRGHKVVQSGRENKKRSSSFEHLENFCKIWKHYKQTRDIRLIYAILGAELVFSGQLDMEHMNYTNTEAHFIFEQFEKQAHDSLLHHVKRLRRQNFAYLPLKYRHKLLLGRNF